MRRLLFCFLLLVSLTCLRFQGSRLFLARRFSVCFFLLILILWAGRAQRTSLRLLLRTVSLFQVLWIRTILVSVRVCFCAICIRSMVRFLLLICLAGFSVLVLA